MTRESGAAAARPPDDYLFTTTGYCRLDPHSSAIANQRRGGAAVFLSAVAARMPPVTGLSRVRRRS